MSAYSPGAKNVDRGMVISAATLGGLKVVVAIVVLSKGLPDGKADGPFTETMAAKRLPEPQISPPTAST
jgi:hypothetical protein